MKVLIAEDNFMIADLVEEFLVLHDYKVCGIAATFAKTIELVKLHKPNLLILDQRLSGSGLGTEVAACLGSVPDLGILYVTGNVASVMEAPVNGHACLAKPYRLEELLRSVKIVMEMVATGRASPPFPRGFQVLPSAVSAFNT